uniref:Hepatocyte growth factor-regulated tyrosine kinase substrate n=1 Tax=Timema shepardi TaxID=629360 RepID=A0A7R9AW32_TIMSH|nr:unnamed protein product [Timema shepardi]
MEQLRDLVRTTNHDNVKNKVLELIQAWAFAFRNSPKYRAVQLQGLVRFHDSFKVSRLVGRQTSTATAKHLFLVESVLSNVGLIAPGLWRRYISLDSSSAALSKISLRNGSVVLTSCPSVQDTVNIMKTEGFKFPALKESDAMFSADTAPEWADADCCHRCRVAFGVVQRKHHCRACGQVFCAQCSSKTSTVPKFGFEKEVRVCEACYDSVNKCSSVTESLHESEREACYDSVNK